MRLTTNAEWNARSTILCTARLSGIGWGSITLGWLSKWLGCKDWLRQGSGLRPWIKLPNTAANPLPSVSDGLVHFIDGYHGLGCLAKNDWRKAKWATGFGLSGRSLWARWLDWMGNQLVFVAGESPLAFAVWKSATGKIGFGTIGWCMQASWLKWLRKVSWLSERKRAGG